MILSNIEIQVALDSGRLIIDPEPPPRRPKVGDPKDKCPYDTHAVDLTLGRGDWDQDRELAMTPSMAMLPGSHATALKRGKPGWRPESASAIG